MPLGVLYKAYIISHQNKISPSLINHLQAINSITCSGLNLCFAAPKLTIIHKSWWLLVMNKIIIEREHIPKPHPHETTWWLLYKEHWDVILPWCLNLWTSMKYWYEQADNHLKFQSMYIQRNQPPKVHPPLWKKIKITALNYEFQLWQLQKISLHNIHTLESYNDTINSSKLIDLSQSQNSIMALFSDHQSHVL